MHSGIVLVQCLRVNGLEREWWIDLPELTSIQLGDGAFGFKNDISSKFISIQLGKSAFEFKDDDSTELIMRSSDDEEKWWIDLPKLTSLTTDESSRSFKDPRIITLEGSLYLFILTKQTCPLSPLFIFQTHLNVVKRGISTVFNMKGNNE